MKKTLVLAIVAGILLSLTGAAMAESYSWYFSQSGDDSTGNGSMGNPWKTLSKANTQIDAVDSSDIVNLYFDRGDTWTADSDSVGTTGCYGLCVGVTDPEVNIGAYGNGAQPIFDGTVTDFSTVPVHSVSGPTRWNRFFELNKAGSIKNVHIQNVYGHGIYGTTNVSHITIENCTINNFGRSALMFSNGASNMVVQKNLIYNGEMLYLNGKEGEGGNWAGAIDLWRTPMIGTYDNNYVAYNVVYDIYGEGINVHAQGGTVVEYNVVGDTGSISIFINSGTDTPTGTVIVRYNFLIHSNTNNIAPTKEGSIGIRYADNEAGYAQEYGDNSSLALEIYGNIIIHKSRGIQVQRMAGNKNNLPASNLGELRIFNNTMIDCTTASLSVSQPDEVDAAYVYNNSSIHYDISAIHVENWDLGSGYGTWDIDYNHFYPVDGTNTVLSAFTGNYLIIDPKLPGEPSIDWDGQSGPTYYKDIKFNDIYPSADSPLINAGKTLGAGYNNIFLTTGTDFGTLPDEATFKTASQTDYGNWEIGACVWGNAIRGDLNDDGCVDIADLAMFVEFWLQCNDPQDSDCEFPF